MFLSVCLAAGALAQVRFIGQAEFDRMFAGKPVWREEKDFGRRIQLAGMNFMGTPYVGGTLEQDPKREFVFCTTQGLDCVTFVESAIALARIAKMPRPTTNAMLREIERMRYRGGICTDYISRLHYTSDWFHDNMQRGLMVDALVGVDGVAQAQFKVGFMSKNPSRYPALANNPKFVRQIEEIEETINKRTFNVLPKAKVAAAEQSFRAGDIVMITTNKAGLDTAHVGLIYVDRMGKRRFMHASSTKKAVVAEGLLSEYLAGRSDATGIMLGRALEK